jgi:hypothetical protein
MQRRTFIRGTAASLASWPLARAWAQADRTKLHSDSPTIVYISDPQLANDLQFNPLEPFNRREDFHRLGLPFPDPNSPLYEIWQRIFMPPIVYQARVEIEEIVEYQLDFRLAPAEAPIITTRWETSQNWSGAYVEPRNDNMFTDVAGSWTIPKVDSGAAPLQSSSIWLGLDGQRLYFDSSLPQIGTTQGIRANGSPDYHAWHQWWERDQKHPRPHRIREIKLIAGDTVFCNVQVVDLSHVIVSIAKFGTPIEFWSRKLHPTLSGTATPKISGATAQWIVERPTDPNSNDLLQLVNYGKVDFIDCLAISAPAPSATTAEFQGLDGARFIRMYKRFPDTTAPRIGRLSEPSRLSPGVQNAFTVSYVGP